MRILIGFIVLFMFVSCLSEKTNHLKEMNLTGKVKSVDQITYVGIKKNGIIKKGVLKEEYSVLFNSNGNKIKEIWKNSDKSIKSKVLYKYNGFQENVEQLFYDRDDSLNIKIVYKYNKKCSPIFLTVYNNDHKILGKGKYIYNDKGNLIRFSSYDTNGTVTMKETYKYDSLGYIKSKESFAVGDDSVKYEYKRDLKGNPVNIQIFNKHGNYIDIKIFAYKFDSNGNWVKRIESLNDTAFEYKVRRIFYW